LTGQYEDKRVIGIHFEVGQEPQFLQGTCLEEMGLVDDEKYGFTELLFGFEESALDLEIGGAFRYPVVQAEESVDVAKQVGAAQGGKGGVEDLEQVFVQSIDIPPQDEGFTHAGITGEKHDAPPSLDIIEPSGALLHRFRIEDIGGFDGFIEWETLEPEPGEEISHGSTSPL